MCPEEPDECLAQHSRHLDEALRYFAGRLVSGVEGDRRRWSAARRQDRRHPGSTSLIDLQNRCEAMMPHVDIGEMVLG